MRTLILPLVLALAGCEPPCDDACADLPPAREVVGDPRDFTLGPESRDGVTITAPYACTFSGDGHAVSVARQGELPVPETFVGDTVELLVADGIEVVTWGFGLCTQAPSAWIAIDDWTRADDAVRILGKALREGDYDGAVELRVQREIIACAQVACGF